MGLNPKWCESLNYCG